MNCETCDKHKEVAPVPYIVHESAMARAERTNKRWAKVALAELVVILLIVFAFLYVWQLYDYSSEESVYTYQQDGEGVNIIGDRNGVDYNGADGYSQGSTEGSNP